MRPWRPQRYRAQGVGKTSLEVLENAVQIGRQVIRVDAALPPVFTLRHLAHASGSDYGLLRAIVSRAVLDPYTVFRIKKAGSRSRDFRVIAVPSPGLAAVQRWISRNVLEHGRPHESSYAYAKGSTILQAAEVHCRCKWLIKLDVRRFFESISEIAVYRVFRALGYQPLIALEMARICTRVGSKRVRGDRRRWAFPDERYGAILSYREPRIGHLPQGAPTSPKLSNLVVRPLDEEISAIGDKYGLLYTRYADDIALSTESAGFSRRAAARVIRDIYAVMGRFGFSPNISKSHVVPPGARKIVLGLLVDGDRPRLTREFRDRLRQHIYYISHPSHGPLGHAEKRGFTSVIGLRAHVSGLIAFARQVDPKFADRCSDEMGRVVWPL